MTQQKRLKTIKRIAKLTTVKAYNLLEERYKAMNQAQKQAFMFNIKVSTGRSEKTIYRWIKGAKPSLADQKIIAEYLNERVGDMF